MSDDQHETMTYEEILEAEGALNSLLGKGFSDNKVAIKLARIHRWVKGKAEEYREARESLVEAHAKTDSEGNRLPGKSIGPDGTEIENPNSFQPKKQDAWNKARKGLLNDTVNLNGVKIRGSDLEYCEADIEPIFISFLGPLYEWDEEE